MNNEEAFSLPSYPSLFPSFALNYAYPKGLWFQLHQSLSVIKSKMVTIFFVSLIWGLYVFPFYKHHKGLHPVQDTPYNKLQ